MDIDEIEGGVEEFFSGVRAAGDFVGFWVHGGYFSEKVLVLLPTTCLNRRRSRACDVGGRFEAIVRHFPL